MSRKSTRLLKTALSLLHYTGTARALAPLARGMGAILMLHRVEPGPPAAFEPNRILRVTPEFLGDTIRQVLEAGFEVLSLDEVAARLKLAAVTGKAPAGRPFVAFTLDDGYRDNVAHAYPVFKRFGVPFTVYVPTEFVDGKGDLWWLVLERSLAVLDRVTVHIDGWPRLYTLATPAEKDHAFHEIYWWLRSIDETVARQIVAGIAAEAGIDGRALCREMIMTWPELKAFARDPLVTIGAHTIRHFALARLGDGAARHEMAGSIARLQAELGHPIRHFSYPFGDCGSAGPRDFAIARDLGLTTAVTTEKGVLHAHHADSLHALPRLSLNGDYQSAHYTDVLLTGVPFHLRDLARRVASGRAASLIA